MERTARQEGVIRGKVERDRKHAFLGRGLPPMETGGPGFVTPLSRRVTFFRSRFDRQGFGA